MVTVSQESLTRTVAQMLIEARAEIDAKAKARLHEPGKFLVGYTTQMSET